MLVRRRLRGDRGCARFVPRVSRVGPQHERDEGEDADGETEQYGRNLEERAGRGLDIAVIGVRGMGSHDSSPWVSSWSSRKVERRRFRRVPTNPQTLAENY